ncbi:hypothetical protein ACK3ZW_07990 [Aeromonas caviae]
MKDINKFKEKISSLHVSDYDVEKFALLYNEIPEGILDRNFIENITTDVNLKQRLSELNLSYVFCHQFTDAVSGQGKGPDLTICTKDKRINIEIVTPLLVDGKEGRCMVFDNKIEPYSSTITVVEEDSFRLRISSVFDSKLKQFKGWINDGLVSEHDINIICINIGYIDNLANGDMDSLWRVFYKDVMLNIVYSDDFQTCKYELTPFDNIIMKDGDIDKPIKQNYFENDDIDTSFISAVLVTQIKKPIKSESVTGMGILFQNPIVPVEIKSLLKNQHITISKGEHPDAYFQEQIKNDSLIVSSTDQTLQI